MKKILLILALVYSFAASAQLDTTKQIQTISVQGYAYKHLQAIYAMLFPTDTLHLKYDWRGIAFKGTSPYFWNGSFWSAFGTGGSGSADSTIYATLYRLDTAKANLRTAINLKLSITDTANMRPRLYAGSNVTITGTYPNLTISSSGGDTSTFVIDTLYNRLAKVVNVDSIRLKSLRLRLNGSDVAPTTTDSTISWDILSSAPELPDSMSVIRSRYDSAHYTVILLNDSTAIFRSFNGQDDTLQFHGGVGADSVIYATIHRTDTLAQNIRDEIAALPLPTIQHAFDLEPGGSVLTKSDSIMLGGFKLNLLNGQIKTTGHSASMKSTDSVLVRDANGDWKSLSQWNLNGGQARTGIYLNSTKTWTKQVPYVFGTTLVFSGNSWSNEGYTSGTPWPTQVTNYFGKTKVIRGRDADDLTGMIMRDYNTYHGRQTDSIAFCDVAYFPLMSLIIGSAPIGVSYADGVDLTKTMNYIRGSWRAFIANYYLDIDTFSVNSLGDANFRAATSDDSLNTKTAVGAIGLGSFSFTKPAGKTSLVIGTYGADGTRTNQGTIVVTNNGTEIFRKNFDSLNIANRGRDYRIKIGLHYEAIILKDIPSAASTIEVTALDDSTRFDYIGFLVPADSAQKPLYINNLPYGAGSPGLSTQRQYIDSANFEIQNAVSDFSDYPVFINNYNRTMDSTIHINASRHLSSTGNDVVAAALLNNIVNIGYKPVITRSATSGGGSGVTTIGTYDTGGGSTDGAVISGSTLYMQKYSSENPGLVPAGFDYIDSVYRIAGKDSIFARYKEGAILAMKDSIGSGGGGSPAGNFDNIQLNRNGSFAAAGSDSLTFASGQLTTKGQLTMNGGSPVLNFGTAAGNPEIAATSTALIFRRNDLGAYTDVTLGSINMNSFSTTGNGSIAGKLSITTGTNKSAGTGTLASGTATISTTQVTANSLIFIQYTSCSNCGSTYISAKTASTSFVVTSTNGADASTFNWWIIN